MFCLLLVGNASYAQLCTGSLGDPVVKIDFGAGTATHAGALPAGQTNYTYTSADFPQDGSYTISNSTAGSGNVWWSTTDHTGNAGGYMMVVNASTSQTDYFYRRIVTGLCPGTTFEFAAWITNLLRTNDISPPNITFTIRTTGSNPVVLKTYDTGIIPVTPTGRQWNQYGTFFTTPGGVTEVEIIMTNKSNGGAPANDLALDDITFRPCGPMITSTITSNGNAATTQSVCVGDAAQNYVLSSNVAAGSYTAPVYQWQSNSGTGWVDVVGQNSTSYSLTFQPTAAGVYQYRLVTAEAANGTNSACRVASNVVSINAIARPTASFTYTYDVSACLLRNVVKFTGTSTPNGPPITSWLWDFGDGETDNTANPTHTYRTKAKFRVKLTVSSNSSCSSTSPEQEVSTLNTMRPDFEFDAQNCPGVPVVFRDRSETDNVTIAKYTLNYGDGSALVPYNNTSGWQHTYTKTGTYPVTLSLTSTDGCVSDVSVVKYVTVTAVGFSFCQSELTQFTDETDPGNTKGFTYTWNFGDPAGSGPGNFNASTQQNPTHRYTIPGDYTVRLTVRSPNGCVDATTTRTLTVRSVPVANFDIENKTGLCGTDSVTFVDKTLAADNISELVWYYDLTNRPNANVVIPKARMRGDKKYHYLYGVNNTSAPITYKARLIARVGAACPDPMLDMDVVIYPTPVVSVRINGTAFASPYALCAGANTVNLTATANIPGTATFSGTGIVNGNTFNPAVSGVGTFTITCVYTGNNTPCLSTTTFNIIVGSPVLTMPATVEILEGKSTQINPNVTGTGSNLTFAWSPATGVSDPTVRNPVFNPTQDTKYTLEITSGGGCKTSASVQINVLKTPVVPNAFTPNNDGINDTWNIQYLSTYPGATVEVFNRNGMRVYYSNGYPKPWDGTTNGASLPVGVYYYVINPRSGRQAIAGSLTLIK